MDATKSTVMAASSMPLTAVWWMKRDLRLRDNPALTMAREGHAWVLPLYVFEPSVVEAPEASAFHLRACGEAVASLRERLRLQGSDILLVRGEAVAALESVYRVATFTHLFSHEETGSAVTFARDRAVAAWCRHRRVAWVQVSQNGVFRPLRDRDTRDARWEAHMRKPALPTASPGPMPDWWRARCAVTCLASVRHFRFAEPVGVFPGDETQVVSEPLAQATLRGFLARRGVGYQGGISSPNKAFLHGSRLSPHLAWGTVSSRFVLQQTQRRLALLTADYPDDDWCARRWRRSLRAFASRLEWRDHFVQRLEDEPAMEFRALHSAYRDLPTVADDSPAEHDRRLALFCAGETGFPLVDASIRCLNATGFLNFRMRAMLTSFACHALRLDWRTVLHPLSRRFLDYDPGIHIAQTQMQAGVVGINTIRCYSPDKQLRDQDPQLTFVRRWIPALHDVPVELLRPRETGAMLDLIHGYPPPCIDFRAETKRSKDLLWGIRKGPEGARYEADVVRRHGSRRTRGMQGTGATVVAVSSGP